MKKILKSQSGMSIVQVLIAAAMMGGLALLMGKMGENQSKMQRGAKESLDINAFHNNIEKILLNSVSCRETISQISELPVTALTEDSGTAISEIRSKIDDEATTPVVTKYQTGKLNNIGTIYIESIKLTRFNEHDIRMRFIIKKLSDGKRKSYGAKSLNKDISLFGKFNGDEPIGCYSQMDQAVNTAVAETCTALGGVMSGTSCINTRADQKNCEQGIEIALLKGIEFYDSNCPNQLVFTDVEILKGNGTSHTLPTNLVPNSLEVHLLGGGGGGGCGGYPNKTGEGGKAGKKVKTTQTTSFKGGETISYVLGALGPGGSYSGCKDGNDGGPTIVNLNGVVVSAAGGRGGDKNGGGRTGESVNFVGNSYAGGSSSGKGSGASGSPYGTGGAGGKGGLANRHSGGNGAKGAIYFKYITYQINATM